MNRFTTLKQGARPASEFEIKRSRFLGFAARASTEEQARQFLDDIRHAHREARHVCHAIVLGAARETQRSSDDGEPSGTAGAPILKAITARQIAHGRTDLSDVVVAVVRYFGGIKLGAGGLMQAYSDAAVAVLDAAVFVTRQRMRLITTALPIAEAARVETRLRATGALVHSVDYHADNVTLTIAVPDDPERLNKTKANLAALTSGEAEPTPGDQIWRDLD